MTDKPRILCVDDEANVLEALARHLRKTFEVDTAIGGKAGIEALQQRGPYAVLVSDLRMPAVDGIAVLKAARETNPDCVRLLLTGQGDLKAAATAVNEGNVFRFLIKPCPVDVLSASLDAAIALHQLQTAERVLLEQTLRGSVQVLVDVLAMTSPEAFGRASRIKRWVDALCEHLDVPASWELEVAALLSQLGSVVLPAEVLALHHKSAPLDDAQKKMVARMPAVTERLLSHIPRLEPVRELLHAQQFAYDGSTSAAGPRGESIPWGARVLRLLGDVDVLEAGGAQLDDVFRTLETRAGKYDPKLVAALRALRGTQQQGIPTRDLPLIRMRPGMIVVNDVRANSGLLLMARGQTLTPELLERLRNFNPSIGVAEPIRCQIPGDVVLPENEAD